ncbi:MAG: pyridoxal phosphate-dependent aminotransferase [SAR324 cluster bacterium]|nr:pyridoxal phosphate-dependent aminotransferase [SAR324 cluster bacterium]
MFSTRTEWKLTANRFSEILDLKKQQHAVLTDLTISNPTEAGFVFDETLIFQSMSKQENLKYQPEPQGLLQAREAISAYYQAKGCHVSSDSIFLTSGTSEAYAFLFKLLMNPDDEVLVPQPGYPLLNYLGMLECVRLIRYPSRYHAGSGWSIDLELLDALLYGSAKALVLVNPNNPTGSFLKQNELEFINQSKHDFSIICDEVFNDYPLGSPESQVPTLVENHERLTFVLSGLSKICGLPQMKLSWIVVAGPADLKKEAIKRLEVIADTFLSVGTPVQQGLMALLDTRQQIQTQIHHRIQTNFEKLGNLLKNSGFVPPLICEGGWYAVLLLSWDQDEELITEDLLLRHNICLHPGYFYDFDNSHTLVISLLTPPDIFESGVKGLITYLSE